VKRGHPLPLKGGGEQDALTGWKHYLSWGRKMLRFWKNKYNRRMRRHLKRTAKEYSDE